MLVTIAILGTTGPNLVMAYDRVVHQEITKRAVISLAGPDVKQSIGFEPATKIGKFTLAEWVAQGAYDEDAVLHDTDPPLIGTTYLSLNHFLDPIHLEPLTLGRPPVCTNALVLPGAGTGVVFTQRADLWALYPSIAPSRPNLFNLRAAHDDYFAVVTSLYKAEREKRAVHLFKSLGHMSHLIQDMAQPDHTRNDQHLPILKSEKSLYESWTAELWRNIPTRSSFIGLLAPDGYPSVALPKYRDYFVTDGTGSTRGGVGLADFSNRNFLTQDTDYLATGRCFNYSSPSLGRTSRRLDKAVPEEYYDVDVSSGAVVILKKTGHFDEWVLSHPVDDKYTGVTSDDRFHAYYSSLDLETRFAGKEVYSLGPKSMNSRAEFLLPRAVQYSAGFMKKFFRGNIEAQWKKTNVGYDLTITNLSPDRIGSDGRLVVNYCPGTSYLASDRDCDTILDATFSSLLISGLNAGETVTIALPTIFSLRGGDDVRMYERRIAIRGTLGTEPDEVIGLVQAPSPPTTIRRIIDFDGYIPPGTTAPYVRTVNIAVGQIGSRWAVQNGSLTLHPVFHTSSAVYSSLLTSNSNGSSQITFWWDVPARRASFKLHNDGNPKSFYILVSSSPLYDGSLFAEVRLNALGVTTVNLPESVSRFTILNNGWGYFAIDDVSWEETP